MPRWASTQKPSRCTGRLWPRSNNRRGPQDLEVATTLKDLGHAPPGGRRSSTSPNRSSARPWRSGAGCWADVHPDVARALHDLAFLLKAQGKLPEAEQSLREAIGQWRAIYGNEHTDLAASLVNLGVVLRDEGEAGRRGAGAPRGTRDPAPRPSAEDHPDIGSTLYNLAKLLQLQRPSRGGRAAVRGGGSHRPEGPTSQTSPTLAAASRGSRREPHALWSRPLGAEPLLREALAIYERSAAARRLAPLPGDEPARRVADEAEAGTPRPSPCFSTATPGCKDNPAVSADRKRNTLERIVLLYEGLDGGLTGSRGAGKSHRMEEEARSGAHDAWTDPGSPNQGSLTLLREERTACAMSQMER